MNRASRVRTAILSLIALGLVAGYSFITQNQSDPDPAVDAMERSLETGKHKQLLTRIAENDAILSDFTTDGCSGGLSIGWQQFAARVPAFADQHGQLPPWQACCVIHDRQYHAGGAGLSFATESFEQRKEADLALKACVTDMGAQRSAELQSLYGLTEAEVRDLYEVISELMYRAVRIGGVPCSHQPWRWGYGWPLCRKATD